MVPDADKPPSVASSPAAATSNGGAKSPRAEYFLKVSPVLLSVHHVLRLSGCSVEFDGSRFFVLC